MLHIPYVCRMHYSKTFNFMITRILEIARSKSPKKADSKLPAIIIMKNIADSFLCSVIFALVSFKLNEIHYARLFISTSEKH